MMNCSEVSRDDFGAPTPLGVAAALIRHPVEMLIRRWNWKSALMSSLFRGIIFLLANLKAGPNAAMGAMLAEFAYRSVTAGFYGALTQAFRSAKPRWLVIVSIPAVSHAFEFLVHWLRGTPNLRSSLVASVIFTLFSTLFSLHAMEQDVLIVGRGGRSLLADFRAIPKILWTFFRSGFGLVSAIPSLSKSR
jgi:hypothetical protein